MSAYYSMPPDTNEKEKIVGGIFTIGQAIWIIGSLIISALLTVLLFRYIGPLVFFLCIPIVVAGFVFAIKKVGDYPLPKYLRLKRKYNNKVKHYINEGTHSQLHFSVNVEKDDFQIFRK